MSNCSSYADLPRVGYDGPRYAAGSAPLSAFEGATIGAEAWASWGGA